MVSPSREKKYERERRLPDTAVAEGGGWRGRIGLPLPRDPANERFPYVILRSMAAVFYFNFRMKVTTDTARANGSILVGAGGGSTV